MSRLIFRIVAACSLILALAILALWLFGGSKGVHLARVWNGSKIDVQWAVDTGTGIAFTRSISDHGDPTDSSMSYPSESYWSLNNEDSAWELYVNQALRQEWHGFGSLEQGWDDGFNTKGFIVPFWFPLFVLMFLPTFCAIGFLRQRRKNLNVLSGKCNACGYDLRATPNRCPECGKEFPTANERR